MKKKVLIAPLDWGLGHAARCIPIIRYIIECGHDVVLATDGRAYHLLQAEFPDETLIRLKGYDPIYPEGRGMVLKMAAQLPKFLTAIVREHYTLKKLIREHKIDFVISDNRYGLWTEAVPSILITHQVFLKMPKHAQPFQPVIDALNNYFLGKYERVWVPDTEESNSLSGSLSHGRKLPGNIKYIGTLSRFRKYSRPKVYDLLVILSGPEPQRTNLEMVVLDQLKDYSSLSCLVVQGKTEKKEREHMSNHIEMVSYLDSLELNEVMAQSGLIIARSGYTNVMDLVHMDKKAVFIPTPGQTEQEYLASYLNRQQRFYYQNQDAFNLKTALEESDKLNGIPSTNPSNDLFIKVLDEALL